MPKRFLIIKALPNADPESVEGPPQGHRVGGQNRRNKDSLLYGAPSVRIIVCGHLRSGSLCSGTLETVSATVSQAGISLSYWTHQ